MFENIINFFKKIAKKDKNVTSNSKDTAKERLHLVLMQDRANVSADFLELMKQEIIDVIKKYIDVDESAIDVRLTNKENDDGTNGAPALYANIPIINIKNETRKIDVKEENKESKKENNDGKKDEKDDKKPVKNSQKTENVENNEIDKKKEKDEKVDSKNDKNKEETKAEVKKDEKAEEISEIIIDNDKNAETDIKEEKEEKKESEKI